MTPAVFFGALAAIGGLWAGVTSGLICGALHQRNVKVNFFLMRLLIIKYAEQYKQITRKETGKIGPLYYHWIGSLLVTWASATAMLIARLA